MSDALQAHADETTHRIVEAARTANWARVIDTGRYGRRDVATICRWFECLNRYEWPDDLMEARPEGFNRMSGQAISKLTAFDVLHSIVDSDIGHHTYLVWLHMGRRSRGERSAFDGMEAASH